MKNLLAPIMLSWQVVAVAVGIATFSGAGVREDANVTAGFTECWGLR